MGVIATLLPTSAHLQRLRTAIRDRHELVVCDDWQALAGHVRAPGRSGRGGRSVRRRSRKLRARPAAQAAAAATHAHRLRRPSRPTVRTICSTPAVRAWMASSSPIRTTPRARCSRSIEQAESRSLGAVVRRSLDDVDPTARDARAPGGDARTRATVAGRPGAIARASPSGRCRSDSPRAGFPAPQRLLTWGRLIVAAHLLEDRHRSADRIATALDFPSASAFRNHLPALPERHAERDPRARRRGVRARDVLLEIGRRSRSSSCAPADRADEQPSARSRRSLR